MRSFERHFPSELRFLLECIRPGEPRPTQLNEFLRDVTDCAALVELAQRHRVAPLCYAALQQLGPDARQHPVHASFEHRYYVSAATSAVLAQRLLAVVATFEQKDIPVIAFKGPALSARIYGNLAFRTSTDLDFLVHPADFWNAVDVLTVEGWQPETHFSIRQRRLFLRSSYALPFTSADGTCRVDLHFRLTEHSLPGNFDVDRLFQDPGWVEVEGQQVRTLKDPALLVYLAYHAGLHFWSQLARLADFVHLLVIREDWNWEVLWAIAEETNVARPFLLALSLSSDLLQCDLPDSVHRRLSADHKIRRHESVVVSHLIDAQGSEPSNLAVARHAVRLLDSIWDKQKYLVQRFAVPTQSDWAWLPLPDQLNSLYFVIRPLRLAWALGHDWYRKAAAKATGR
jgi:hypothetical protein